MPAPTVRGKERSRTKCGRWRKKRSDVGQPRKKGILKRLNKTAGEMLEDMRRGKVKFRVNKIEETANYGNIFDVFFPVRFYFNKDGSFDGIEVTQENPTKRDEELIEELCEKLAKATGIEYVYRAEEKEEDG